MLKNIFANGAIMLFIGLFIYTGIEKILEHDQFFEKVRQSPWLKFTPSGVIWALPITELFVSGLLITRRWRMYGLYGTFLLFSFFTVYMISLNFFEYYIPCSCGGFFDTLPNNIHIILNTVLTIIAGVSIYIKKHSGQIKFKRVI
jgi:hypothetical protein